MKLWQNGWNDALKNSIFNHLDPDTRETPNIKGLKSLMKKRQEEYEVSYNKYFGSMFRTKLEPSFFSMQVSRYADLYTTSVLNLLNYPTTHLFLPRFVVLPHERELLSEGFPADL